MLNQRIRTYLVADLECAPQVLARLLTPAADPAVYDRRPDPARFTLREMTAHLADWETVFLTRLTQTLTEENAVLQGLDEGQIAIDRNYAQADPEECLARYDSGRESIIALLRGLSPPEWQHAGIHTEIGRLTLEDQVVMIAAHDGYHRGQALRWLVS